MSHRHTHLTALSLSAGAVVALLAGLRLHDLTLTDGCRLLEDGDRPTGRQAAIARVAMAVAGPAAVRCVSQQAPANTDLEALRDAMASLLGVPPYSQAVDVLFESATQLVTLLVVTAMPWMESVAYELSRHGRLTARDVWALKPGMGVTP